MKTAFTVVYDSSALFSARLRDLLVRLALTGLFRAKWTDDIHEEWIRAVLAERPHLERWQLERTRHRMNAAVQDCLVEGYQGLMETLALPDPDDRHVLAAAIRSGAQTIVTFNLDDFPPTVLGAWDIEAHHPDDFVVSLMDLDSAKVFEAVREQRAALAKPAVTAEALLEGFERNALAQTVARLRASIALI